MSEITFALAIPHTPWVDSRKESFERLTAALDWPEDEREALNAPVEVLAAKVFLDREPNRVWAQKLWRWAASTGATHLVQLQDDCEVSPDFWARLHAMVEANPQSLIGLQAAHPAGPDLNARGDRWYVTNAWLVGVGYVFPIPLLIQFLAWCNAHPDEVAARNEDDLISHWAKLEGIPVWHPIPTLIDHDTSVESTYKNDTHAHRRPTVTWRDGAWSNEQLASVEFWRPAAATKVLPSPYSPANAINMRKEHRARYHARFAAEKPAASICVAVVDKGIVVPACMMSIVSLLRAAELETNLLEYSDLRMWEADVVRVRNRIVQYFLEQTDDTHLLFVDSDIEFQPAAVMGMLRAEKGMVACPYPRRNGVNWENVAKGASMALSDGGTVPLESWAYQYSILGYDVAKAEIDPETYTCEVEGVGFGLVLLRREELQKVSDAIAPFAYEDSPWQLRPTRAKVTNLFGLMRGDDNGLLSEDFSFCKEWLVQGQTVNLYLGPGAPASHWGIARHGGHIEALGLRRETK